jgi:hypothetical protein
MMAEKKTLADSPKLHEEELVQILEQQLLLGQRLALQPVLVWAGACSSCRLSWA